MKRYKEIGFLIDNGQNICDMCERWKGQFTKDDKYICKYNTDNKGLINGICRENPQNYKCKYFKRDFKHYTHDFMSKCYHNDKVKTYYEQGKFIKECFKPYKIEFDGYYRGYRYVVMFVRSHRCGYVEIPEKHILYGICTYETNINCHGGITYCEHNNNNYPTTHNDGYWIGFDTAHFGDGNDIETAYRKYHTIQHSEYEMELKFKQGGEIRSFEYVENECKNIIDQLIEKE